MKRKFIPIPNLTGDEIKRFWSHISVKGTNDCWEWKATLVGNGYGKLRLRGKDYRAHRIAYFLKYDTDPKELCVCHKCDNPKCCNPSHLWLGTVKDNNQDKVKKGRSLTGEKHPLQN